MKTLKNFTKFSFLALVVLLTSCSSDDGGDNPIAVEGTITASVAGASFTSMEMATSATKITAGGTTTIAIQGTDMSGKTIRLQITGNAQAGTYEIGGDNVISVIGTYIEVNIQNPQNPTTTTYVAPFQGGAVAGSITISEMTDTKVVGSFNFTAKNQSNQNDSKSITNGAFNVELD